MHPTASVISAQQPLGIGCGNGQWQGCVIGPAVEGVKMHRIGGVFWKGGQVPENGWQTPTMQVHSVPTVVLCHYAPVATRCDIQERQICPELCTAWS